MKQDSTYKAASLHFDNLAQRYPEPIVSLNLIKQEETGRPKETLLFGEYTNCIRYLNKQLQNKRTSNSSLVPWHQHERNQLHI